MTLDKAIEILKLAISDPDSVDPIDLLKAQRLGIEAMKAWDEQRKDRTYHHITQLPGEDPE